MDQVIELSSDTDISKTPPNNSKQSEPERKDCDTLDVSFEKFNKLLQKYKKDNNELSSSDELSEDFDKIEKPNIITNSSESDYEFELPDVNLFTRILNKREELNKKVTINECQTKKLRRFSEYFDKLPNLETDINNKFKKHKSEKNLDDIRRKQDEREKKIKERALAKEKLLNEKKMRKELYEKHKLILPGECIKYVKALIDPSVLNTKYGSSVLACLTSAGMSFSVSEQLVPASVTWTRQVQPQLGKNVRQLAMSDKVLDEPFAVVVWSVEQIILLVVEKTLIESIVNIKNILPDYRITLALCGIIEYFRIQKKDKEKNESKKVQGNVMSREDFEYAMTELQIVEGVGYRNIETAADLGLFIQQHTKSVAEAPYKADRFARDVLTDNCTNGKDCVSVVRGVGLQRLFKQQLVQFPRATLETAEAILDKYPSVSALMQAYDNCTPEEGASMLTDIPVRRAAGPLSKSKKIGAEMSRKIFVFYTALDGDTTLDKE